MTAPPFGAPLGPNAFYGPDADEVDRFRKVLGYTPRFTSHPGLVAALAQANPSHEDLTAVSQFVESLELAKSVKLARISGAYLPLDDQDRAYLNAINEPHDDVDVKTARRKQADAIAAGQAEASIPHGFFGKVGHALAGNSIVNNPVTRGVVHGLDRAADISTGLIRQGSVAGALTGGIPNTADIAESAQGMQDRGYNPTSIVSTFAFYSRGEQNYHDLTDLRAQFGAARVAQVQKYLENPDSFVNYKDPNPDNISTALQAINDPAFVQLTKLVDARHMSSGRDLARAANLDPGTAPYKILSGATDALVSWYADPTLIAGKGAKAYRAFTRGLNDLTDGAGVERIMANNKAVQRGWRLFVTDAATIADESLPDAERATAFARVSRRSPDLMPVLDEINGRRFVRMGEDGRGVFEQADPIRLGAEGADGEFNALTKYLVDKNALVRMAGGLAPRSAPLMPGAVSVFGARMAAIRSARTGAAVRATDRAVVDYDKHASKLMPLPGDAEGALNEAAQRGAAINAVSRTDVRSTFATAARRLTTLLPTKTTLDFYDPAATEQIRRFAALYMPKSEANLLAAKFAASDLAGRRQVYKATVAQMATTAGLTTSVAGQGIVERMLKGVDNLSSQAYSATRDGADELATDSGLRKVALTDGQLSPSMWLPAFSEIRKAAAKISVYEHITRRGLESERLDKAMSGLRLGWLVTASGGLRNALDEIGGLFARGMTMEALRARGELSRQRNLGLLLRELPEAEHGNVKSMGQYWTQRALNRVRYTKFQALSAVSDKQLSGWVTKLGEEDSQDVLHVLDGLSTSAIHGVVIPHSADEIREIVGAGFRAGEVKFKQDGWGLLPVDGAAGLRAWSQNLQQWMENPEHLRALMAVVRHDGPATRDGAIGSMLHGAHNKRFREEAEVARGMKSANPEDARAAAADVVDRQVRALRALVTDRDGNLLTDLAGQLDPGTVAGHAAPLAPSVDWLIRNIPEEMRPEHAIGRKWVALPSSPGTEHLLTKGAKQLGKGYIGALSAGYEHFVSRPAAYLSRHPIYATNYVRARKNLEGYRKALSEGEGALDHGVAEDIVHKLALQHAMDHTVQMVDNPEVASQFSLLSRNMLNFERATEDWARRWGRTFIENPEGVRKLQLAYEGGIHSGFVKPDEQGNPIFVYPGSGHAINAVLKGMGALSLGRLGGVQYPMITPDLRSNVMFLNASLDNPIALTASPIVATPLKFLSGFFPQDGLMMSKMDTIINGKLGAGRGFWDQILPTTARRFVQALDADEYSSQLASAGRNALLHLEAGGHTPGPTATDDERQTFVDRVKTQVRNQLVVRAAFAFFLPSAPSLPDEATADETPVDPSFAREGIRDLKSEYRALVNKTGDPQMALAVFARLHPDELAFTVGTTTLGTAGGNAPVTDESLKWMEKNKPLFDRYRQVAAYFIPPNKGPFSQTAWNAMLSDGLRKYKSLDTFYRDVTIVGSERVYYDAKDRRDVALANAKAAGDKEMVKAINADWTERSQIFMAQNPLLKAKFATYDDQAAWRGRAIGELKQMVADPSAVDIPGLDNVKAMIQAYDAHTEWTAQMRGRRDAISTAQKQAEHAAYQQHLVKLVGDDKRLKGLYDGIFRGLGNLDAL